MESPTSQFLCRVQTLQGQVLSCEATSLVYPALDGLAGVLGRAGPVAAALGAGPLAVRTPDGRTVRFFVAGGFARVRDDGATILAEECTPAEGLRAPEAQNRLEQALAMPARSPEEAEARDWTVRVARARLRLAADRH
jgi:F0F1-type ATP synthase epsilon subunit